MNRWSFRLCTVSLFWACLPAAAQDAAAPDIPPPPDGQRAAPESADSSEPRTFIEDASPADLGATVVADPSGRLVVHNLVAGGLAAAAGLREGDTIVSVDGRFLTERDSFHEHLASRPGQPVRLIVLRDGSEQTIRLQSVAPEARDAEIRPAVGVRFTQGPQVILSEVISGSPADLAGLRPGDHVVAVNGEVVSSSDHFITLVAAAPFDETLQLAFVRNQERHWASFEPAAWDHVFAATSSHVALKPAADVVAAPAVAYYTAPYIATNVSPVVVPAAWYYPYHYPWHYGYYHWAYPYYSVYSAYYYPAWYYAPLWPYYRPPYVPTAPAPPVTTESAEVAPGRAARLVQTTVD